MAAAAQYLVRVTFGTALITSVLLVWLTIIAILTSSQSSDSDRRRAPTCLSTNPAAHAAPALGLAPCLSCSDIRLRRSPGSSDCYSPPNRYRMAKAVVSCVIK